MALIATGVYLFGILLLIVLDHEPNHKSSRAIWLPLVWLLIIGSRPISSWLSGGGSHSADYLEGSPLDRNIFLGLIAAGAVVLAQRRKAIGRFFQANPVVLVFVLYCALSIAWSDYPAVTMKRWIKSVGDLEMMLILLTEREPDWAIKKVFATVGFILFPLSILTIKYYPDLARYYSRWDGRMFVSGVAEDKNMLGMSCLVFGLAALWRLLTVWQEKHSHRFRRVGVHGSVVLMVLMLFYKADSMTSLSCFVLAGGIMIINAQVPIARKPAVVHMLVAVAVLSALGVLFMGAGDGALETLGRDPTLTGRTYIWRELLDFSGNPIIGTGFQSFWLGGRLRSIWAEQGVLYGLNEAHNAYLEIYLNLGWIGVALLGILLVSGYRNVMVKYQRDRSQARLWLSLYVAAVIYGFTESAAFGMMSPVWFGFLIASTIMPRASSGTKRLATADAPALGWAAAR